MKVHYEDDYILVVEKPAGMPCVPVKNGKRPTLSDLILEMRPEQAKIGKAGEAGIVHRLDNDTSGLVVAAKTKEVYENLRDCFTGVRNDNIKKEYTALVVGDPPDEGTITTPIAHHPRKKRKMIVCESETRAKSSKARGAETIFKVSKRFGARYALLSVEIKTGVRHQIRVHLASIGFPIAGDRLYQNPKKRSEDTLPLEHHFLHASKLGFTHPKTGKWIEVSSPLPQEFKEIFINIGP